MRLLSLSIITYESHRAPRNLPSRVRDPALAVVRAEAASRSDAGRSPDNRVIGSPNSPDKTGSLGLVLLFGSALFLSSLLMFVVEPMVAKRAYRRFSTLRAILEVSALVAGWRALPFVDPIQISTAVRSRPARRRLLSRRLPLARRIVPPVRAFPRGRRSSAPRPTPDSSRPRRRGRTSTPSSSQDSTSRGRAPSAARRSS